MNRTRIRRRIAWVRRVVGILTLLTFAMHHPGAPNAAEVSGVISPEPGVKSRLRVRGWNPAQIFAITSASHAL
jgi:hypothetical protein